MSNNYILTEHYDRICLLTLNRPEACNALSSDFIQTLEKEIINCEEDPNVHCIILMGQENFFSAGADIKEMYSKTYVDAYLEELFTKGLESLANCRKPIIAAVSGYALGGGCELAMMCDIIIAADNAKFGQPEITLGTMPGAGGTQRLSRFIGKSKAMDLCLTGRIMKVQEAEQCGLVSRTVLLKDLKKEALQMAQEIAKMSLPVAMMIKEAIKQAYETSLVEGLRFEKRMFHSTFALQDQEEGMLAFLEKRSPSFKNK